jgi:hypothetical protein
MIERTERPSTRAVTTWLRLPVRNWLMSGIQYLKSGEGPIAPLGEMAESERPAIHCGGEPRMSRLYYETERPQRDAAKGQFDQGKRTFKLEQGGSSPEVKSFLEKIAKLIPSEVIAGYITLIGLLTALKNPGMRPVFYAIAFILCLVLTPIYLNYQADPGKPKKIHLIVSMFAFVVWAYATSGQQVVPQLYDPAIASFALVAFSLISGAIPLRT